MTAYSKVPKCFPYVFHEWHIFHLNPESSFSYLCELLKSYGSSCILLLDICLLRTAPLGEKMPVFHCVFWALLSWISWLWLHGMLSRYSMYFYVNTVMFWSLWLSGIHRHQVVCASYIFPFFLLKTVSSTECYILESSWSQAPWLLRDKYSGLKKMSTPSLIAPRLKIRSLLLLSTSQH